MNIMERNERYIPPDSDNLGGGPYGSSIDQNNTETSIINNYYNGNSQEFGVNPERETVAEKEFAEDDYKRVYDLDKMNNTEIINLSNHLQAGYLHHKNDTWEVGRWEEAMRIVNQEIKRRKIDESQKSTPEESTLDKPNQYGFHDRDKSAAMHCSNLSDENLDELITRLGNAVQYYQNSMSQYQAFQYALQLAITEKNNRVNEQTNGHQR